MIYSIAKTFIIYLFGKRVFRRLKSIQNQTQNRDFNKRRKFYKSLLSKGDLFFDIGANYGNRIEPIIDSGINIIAVEPQAECVDFLSKRYGDEIKIIPCGLGEKPGKQKMYISDINVLSSFSEEWIKDTTQSGRFKDIKWKEERLIEIRTLDDLIVENGIPNFIKIDVEGYELEVLKGLNTPIKMLSLEYTVPERTDNLKQCIHRLIEIYGESSARFNYSIGESLVWSLDKWLPASDMIELIHTETFQGSEFGDIYVSSVKFVIC